MTDDLDDIREMLNMLVRLGLVERAPDREAWRITELGEQIGPDRITEYVEMARKKRGWDG